MSKIFQEKPTANEVEDEVTQRSPSPSPFDQVLGKNQVNGCIILVESTFL